MKQYTFHNRFPIGELTIDIWSNASQKSVINQARILVLKFFYPAMPYEQWNAKEAKAHMDYRPDDPNGFLDFRPTAMAIQETCREVYYNLNLSRVQDSDKKVAGHAVHFLEHDLR